MKALLRRIFVKRWWTLALFWLATAGFMASLAVHITAYFSHRVLAERNGVFVLHILCLALAALTIPFTKRLEKVWGKRKNHGTTFAARHQEKIFMVLGAYALINFFLFMGICWFKGESRVWKDEDAFYASGRNGEKRELTQDEYLQHEARVMRGFSGHWMLFFGWPALFFLNLKPTDLVAPEVHRLTERHRAGGPAL